jgi:hypothetical protein
VLECVELCRCGNQCWVLAFYADFLLDADVLSFVLECSVVLIVDWCSSTAERYGQAVADAEASERLLLSMLRLEGADFENEGGVKDEEVKGDGGWQRRIECLWSWSAVVCPCDVPTFTFSSTGCSHQGGCTSE